MNIDSLSEGRWVLDLEGQNVSGLLSDRVVTRKITGLNIKDLPALVEILRQRTSILNPDDGTKYYSVKNPSINGVIQEGVFRGISVKAVEGVHSPGQTTSPAGTITQVLAYGWATAIAGVTTNNWIEARLVQNPNLQPLGATNYKFLTVMWPSCASDKLKAMAASLSAATFVDPIINGETYAGTWYNSGVTPKLAQDGSGIITLQLSIQYRDIPFQVSAISSDASVETRQQLNLTTETPEPVVAVAGQIKTQQVTVLDDSSKNVHTNRDIGVAQTTKSTIESGFDKSVTEEKTVQAAELSVPTPVSATNHVIEQVVNKPSKYPLRFDTTSRKETPIAVSTPEYLAALSEHESVYRLEEKHAAAIPVIALGANDASVSLTHDLDAFLTHNYAKTRVVKAFPFAGEKTWTIWGDREIVTSQVYSDTLGRYWNDHSYLYHLYQEVTVKYFKTVDEAIAYIHLASGTEPAGGGYTVIDSAGSGWSRTGEFE